ncbi:MAG: winged helix-turn-helix domain-containing protein, partial [Halofilum sp. (in: g-proteobacteria)]
MGATNQDAKSASAATFGNEPAALPLYAQVKKHLIHRVLNGEWQPGKRLPSEAEIAQGYGLSLGTVRKAIKEMVDEGLVARWPGRGTFVTSHGPGGHRPFRFNCVHRDDGE